MDPQLSPPQWRSLKEVVRRFEAAWRASARPSIDDHLPPENPLYARALVELVHIDLELRLKAGDAAVIEEYLSRYPELSQDRAVAMELIAAEYNFRRRREPGLAFEECLQRFPQFHMDPRDRTIGLPDDSWDGPGRSPDPSPEKLPEVEGYEVLAFLGRGGMGAVYKARQHRLDRHVALKFLPDECTRDPVWLARFRREARTASALNHPYICTIYDTGESAGRPFLSMELVDGRTVERLLADRPSVQESARFISQAAQALAAAHAAGVVHRDIKPANLMVRDDGILKVLDFGLARLLHRDHGGGPLSLGDSTRREGGGRVGTLRYMSPEQARAEPADAASDIFSLGLVMYELVSGRHPFAGESEIDLLHAICTHSPLPPSRLNPEVPAALELLLQHMLAKDPRQRPTAVEVDAALSQFRALAALGAGHTSPVARRRLTVGRKPETAALRHAFDNALAGHGSLVCVTGEPGLGKTTFVESFLEELPTGQQPWRLARGGCSERLAGAEAYLPFLEALDSLLHGDAGAAIAQQVKVLAPTWYVQLAPLATDDPALARVLADARQGTQERRKREMSVLLHELSRQRPLVVFLDDVHWSDPSSVDLLAYLGRHCAGWPLLFVLTYRPSDLLRSQHPFGSVKLEFQGRGICHEIALPFLQSEDLSQYLALAFAGHQFPPEFAAVLCSRTEGNPLFVVDLLHYLRDSGVIVQEHGRWTLAQPVTSLQRQWPGSVRGMIQRKIDQLTAADRQLLMAASVQGSEFDSAVVARVLDGEAADVEERLNVLEHVHYLVRKLREHAFPDGTLTVRYAFVHALYQDAFYGALQPTRKAAWSAAAARALLHHHSDKSAALAAELALLFEGAHERERAAGFYLEAAKNAARVFAHHEAVALARRGLVQVQLLPETPERAAREIQLQSTLGVQLQIVHGYASPEAERTYLRARALCEQVQDAPKLFLVLWGLWMFYEVSSVHDKSWELAERLLAIAQESNDTAQIIQAHMALAVSSFSLGNPAATHKYTTTVIALYDRRLYGNHSYLYGQDPLTSCLAFDAASLWLLGFPDLARDRGRRAVELATELGHPTSRSLTLYFNSMVRQYCRDPQAVLESAQANTAIGTEHGLSLWIANGRIMRGWALAQHGAPEPSLATLQQGMEGWLATGAGTHFSYFMGLQAEVLAKAGRPEEALAVLTSAIDRGPSFHTAELHRLKGELLLRMAGAQPHAAESSFREALDIARRQQAKSLELRAIMSLARHHGLQKQNNVAASLLADCLTGFTEGFQTPDLLEATALIEQLQRS